MTTIAIDIDDVIASHAEAFIAFSNERYGTRLTLKDYDEEWSKLWNVEWEEIERRAREFHTSESVLRYRLIQEADKAIAELGLHYRLAVVTARPKHLIQPTNAWLEEYFAGTFDAVHFVPIWEPNNSVTKGDICKQIGADYLIDDAVRHCNTAAEGGVKALLYGDYAWTRRAELVPGVTRVKNWREVVEYFERERSR